MMQKLRNKIVLILFTLTAVCLFLTGCGNAPKDEYGCFKTFEAAKASSKKTGKNILVMVTMDGDDQGSSVFINDVVKNPDFSKVQEEYSVVLMDFSQKSYEASIAQDESDKDAVKKAAENDRILRQNMLTATLLNTSLTPAFYLLSKDGLFVSVIEYIEEINSPSDFLSLLSKYDDKALEVNSLASTALKAPSQERLSAVNTLYDSTDAVYRPFLSEFIELGVKLASGNPELKSKFLVAKTDNLSTRSFLMGDAKSAVQGYVELAANKELTAEYCQQAWYMAAYLLAMSDSSQYDTIITYLQNAIQAAPDSPDALSIQRAINELGGN